MLTDYRLFNGELESLGETKMLINTLNAHSYNIARKDESFAHSLHLCDVLLPDGISIVLAKRLLDGQRLQKIAGADLFMYEMNRLNKSGGRVFFMGSTVKTLKLIKDRASVEYPNVRIYTYSPPYKNEFSKEDNESMLKAINKVKPDVLFLGMTAPKQEKWAYNHFNEIKAGHIGCIGAVFDFYSGNIRRAPSWLISLGFEWFYRLIMEPGRL